MTNDKRMADQIKGKTHTILLTRDQSQDLSATSDVLNLAGIQGAAARTGFRNTGQQLNSTARTNIESNGATNNSGTNDQMLQAVTEKTQQATPTLKDELKRKGDGQLLAPIKVRNVELLPERRAVFGQSQNSPKAGKTAKERKDKDNFGKRNDSHANI